jgi:hypothetical protein
MVSQINILNIIIHTTLLLLPGITAWVTIPSTTTTTLSSSLLSFKINNGNKWGKRNNAVLLKSSSSGNLHGENSCFLPLLKLDQDYFYPVIVPIAGTYPGITKDELQAVSSVNFPEQGQWNYDFSDPEGPQLGTVSIPGAPVVYNCVDPVVVISEHTKLGVELPKSITEPVDLICLVDRSRNYFEERQFLLLDVPGNVDGSLLIAAFSAKKDIPEGSTIVGHVVQVQIPWLPAMKSTKTGFMEEDEYF